MIPGILHLASCVRIEASSEKPETAIQLMTNMHRFSIHAKGGDADRQLRH